MTKEQKLQNLRKIYKIKGGIKMNKVKNYE